MLRLKRVKAREVRKQVAVDSNRLFSRFQAVFGRHLEDAVWVARAPGRVNLIGEHIDYSGGFVLPVAVGYDVAIAFRPRTDRIVRLYSCEYRRMSEFCLDGILPSTDAPWSNFFRGVAWALSDRGSSDGGLDKSEGMDNSLGESEYELRGLDAVISGDVPIGAGLSSSAALEVASAFALLVAAGMDTDILNSFKPECGLRMRRGIALTCQKAENLFVGVGCGIMDQMASCMGRAGCAIYLDCRSLWHEPIELGLDDRDAIIVVYDTGVRRGLVDSEYNRRRQEVETGAKMISNILQRSDVHTLRDVNLATFLEVKGMLPSKVACRCDHVVREIERVKDGVAALRQGALDAFGDLMWESHESLRDLYEVSCPELDIAVEIARKTCGVLGARMTGAGFGGCTVNLVRRDALPDLIGALPGNPMRLGAIEPRAFVIDVVDGAKVCRL